MAKKRTQERADPDRILSIIRALDLTAIVFFDHLRVEQPAFAMKIAQGLLVVSKKDLPELAGALKHVGLYAEILTRPPTQPIAH